MRVTNRVDVPVDLSAGGILAPGVSVDVADLTDPHDAWLVTAGIVGVVEAVKPKTGKAAQTEENNE